MKRLLRTLWLLLLPCALLAEPESAEEASPQDIRALLQEIIFAGKKEQPELVEKLTEYGDPLIKEVVESWKVGEIRAWERDGQKVALRQVGEQIEEVGTGEIAPVSQADFDELKKLRAPRKVRKRIAKIVVIIDLNNPDKAVAMESAIKLGVRQQPEHLELLRERFEKLTDEPMKLAYQEAIALSLLANGDEQERFDSIELLGELKSDTGRDKLAEIVKAEEESETPNQEVLAAAQKSIRLIEAHLKYVERWGSLIRGVSTGSVLLMVAFGLAITFGLMGVINMAHGEFIAIGGYTCFVVQGIFEDTLGVNHDYFGAFFLVSLPVAFLAAAFVGFLLERGLIRHLYNRPLESLLATWGVSMIFQQAFRLQFGAANVQVNVPETLLGNFEYAGVAMSYTRVFIIFLAIVTCIMTWALLSKTRLGLYIRAVMQNRNMASSLGIPVSRVNSMTFAFGCGLAGLAGAAISQIGNVGPDMGQVYLVDSFIVVVIGSVGNLLGAALSSLGIGVVDQMLQPELGPVMGKITVFFVIILFLQWRPQGLFPTKSRSLDD